MRHHDDAEFCVQELRTALAANGITLPSLGTDAPSFASAYAPALIALGNCNQHRPRPGRRSAQGGRRVRSPLPAGPLVLGLLALPKTVPEARHAVREHLGAPCPDGQLCVSELLGNVIRHVGEGAPVTLRLAPSASGRVRLEVTDPGPHAWLVVRRPAADDEAGRGLLLLDAVATRWGVRQDAAGKTVWCEVDVRTGEGRAVSGRSAASP